MTCKHANEMNVVDVEFWPFYLEYQKKKKKNKTLLIMF